MDKSHFENIAKEIKDNIILEEIDYKQEIKNINRAGWNYYLAPWKRLFLYLKKLNKIKIESGDKLFFASNNEFDFFCGWVISNIYNNVYISFVCHANLNQIYSWQTKNPIRRFFQYKPSITRISKSKIKLICLESLVAKNLLAEIPNLINNIKIIPHPIDELEKIQLAKKDKLTIAFVGILSPEKRPELFEQLTQCVNNSKYNFSVIGWAHKPESFNFKNCIHLPSKGPLPQETMQKQLAESDFICMLHEPEHYKLSASGVLLDAIKYKKPILHLNSELVLEIEKTSGQFTSVSPFFVQFILRY